MSRWTLAALAVGLGLLAGCSPDEAPTGNPVDVPSSVATPRSGATPTAPAPSLSVPEMTIGVPPGDPTPDQPSPTKTTKPGPQAMTIEPSSMNGREGSVTWAIDFPLFSQHPAAPETNRRIRAAVTGLVDQAKREGRDDQGDKRTLTGQGVVTTNDGRTAQVVINYSDDLAGTAHPTYYVTTTVVDVGKIRPVLIEQVLQNPPEGLRFLGDQVVKVAKKKGDPVDRSGLKPKAANFANWQSTKKGLEFHFNDYQLGGHGLRVYTVPWESARLVLSGYGEQVLLPK